MSGHLGLDIEVAVRQRYDCSSNSLMIIFMASCDQKGDWHYVNQNLIVCVYLMSAFSRYVIFIITALVDIVSAVVCVWI